MGKRGNFEQRIARGRIGETMVAEWLKGRGWGVIPSYDFTGSDGCKAPRLMFEAHGLVIPDLDTCRDGKRCWCEVKTYRGPYFNRRLRCDIHGIPSGLFHDYLQVENQSGCPVYLFVLEVDSACLLAARLSSIQTHGCMCRGCATSNPCRAPIKRGLYWPRSEMWGLHQFGDDNMLPLQEAWRMSEGGTA